jgi:hypothetical protein
MATVGAIVREWNTDGQCYVLIRSGDNQSVAQAFSRTATQWVAASTLWEGFITHGQRHIKGGCTEVTAETVAKTKLAEYVNGSRAKASWQTSKESALGI